MDKKNNSGGFSLLTIDMLENHKKLPYTYKEILQQKYPQFWGGANESVRILKEVQKFVLESLPDIRKIKSCSFEQLKEHKEIQLFFLNYLNLRSIYGLAYKIWNLIDSQCRNLAKAANAADKEGVQIAQEALISEMSFVETLMKSFNLFADLENGFYKLGELVNDAPFKIDFLVLAEGSWMYSDIMGIVNNQGVVNEDLWNSSVKDNDPTETNVIGLMESPEDEKTVRMY